MKTHYAIFLNSAFKVGLAGLAAFYISACRAPELTSTLKDRDILIDGADSEWTAVPQLRLEDRAAVSAVNNNDTLFLRMVTSDPALMRQVMMEGLIVWLDPQGGKEKNFGIRFPLQVVDNRPPDWRKRKERDPGLTFENRRPGIVLQGPSRNKKRWMRNGAEGIAASIEHAGRQVVYELQVPLSFEDTYGFTFKADSSRPVGIGLETEAPDREDMKRARNRPEGDIAGPGLGGGMRGGMPGGGQGMDGGRPVGSGGRSRMEPLEVWIRLTLAQPGM